MANTSRKGEVVTGADEVGAKAVAGEATSGTGDAGQIDAVETEVGEAGAGKAGASMVGADMAGVDKAGADQAPVGKAASVEAATAEAAHAEAATAEARLSSSIGDYLKTIWQLAGDGAAGTGDIARELDVTAPSVTGMLGKMNGMGLVRYQPYRGAELSEAGRREALRLVRRHRLLETFMIAELGFGWEEVHAEAELMEHVVSDDFTERLASYLGQPEFDPHGDPIPRADGSLPTAPDTPLADLQPGQRFRVHRVLSQDSEVLGYLESSGLEPGTELTLRVREPGGHLLRLQLSKVGGAPAATESELALSRELASLVLGKVVGREP